VCCLFFFYSYYADLLYLHSFPTRRSSDLLTFKFVPLFVAGIPDRICLLPGGRIFFAEIKTTKQKPKKLQLFWHAKLRKLGFRVEVIDTSEQIENILKDYE